MAQNGLWNVARERMLQDRGALPEEEGDFVRSHKAMHEENFLSSCLREDVVGTERRKDRRHKVREEESRSGKRQVEREQEKTVVVKRRCVDHFPSDVVEEWMIWEVSGILGTTCVVTPVTFRSVCLRCHRVCLL